ncbi:MAG TPA: PBP1A family penicillin-binding protein, partial [Coleofasciculaceae cyanobacterium]
MSKFIPKHKDDRSSQFSSGASMAPEPEAESSHSEVQDDEKNQESSGNSLLTRCVDGLKRASSTVTAPFTGPKPLHRRYWFWVGLGVSGSALALGWGWTVLEKSVTDSTADALTFVRDDTITIKAADGTILQQIGPATRETLKYSEIPKSLVDAFIAIEDQRFQQHHGVDFQGIARAAINNLVAGDVVEGGSTITQQLARIVYFDQEQTVWRKLKEMRMAQKLEEDLSKEQILERYLNLVYLGSGAYGVGDAAWVYFSKPVKDLSLSEIAMLAALPPAPTGYSPFVNPTVAKQRRDIVLRRMQEKGFISKEQAEEAIATPLTPKRSNPKRLDRQAYYFTEYVQQELPKYVSKDVLAKKGLTIETTLNPTWQTAAEDAVKNTIENNGRWEGFKQAALVAIDPRNGQIKAMVGGKDFYDQQFNRVTQAQRQPGSTFKTFVYATAIAAGISPHRGYLDAPFVVDGYEPKNYSEKFRGWLSIKDALTNSVNVVAVKALIDIGWNPVITIAKKMGSESTLQPTYSLALGASEVNLLELTSAYGTLATNGTHVKP